ncbi:uncharacterized protein LOC119740011 [Patiria miniata]|uniref:CxC5 like cysteine cluster associated with KDZ domain-containing protein n=1 Tax=Patiria miniata TaxID=46514 RepID=A0A914B4X7_PATMI|nr:uncharacterized protein LOC119740011 [Patiria miniata]
MPKKKVAKLNFTTFLSQLEADDEAVEQYQRALEKINISSTSFRQLSTDEQFGVVVSRFGFLEVCRVQRAIESSDVSSFFDANLFSESLGADSQLCQFLLAVRRPTLSASTSSSTCESPSSSSLQQPSLPSSCSLISSSFSPVDSFDFCLVPPYSTCISCEGNLGHNHVDGTKVKVITLNGCKIGRKSTLRCRHCSLIYRYDSYGNATLGFNLYKEQRQFVRASNTLYLERQLLELQCSLANHSWVSFVGFAESFNDAFGLSRQAGVTSKHISSAFCNGELENELRDLQRLDMFGLMKANSKSDRVKILEQVECIRRQQQYAHPKCHPNCAAKGCGRVFVADGIWKLSFPHCMHKCENKVSGIPVPSLPDVCTKSPVKGKAFCLEHCANAKELKIPTDLHAFLKHCDVKQPDPVSKGPSTSTGSQGSDKIADKLCLAPGASCNAQTIAKVEEVLSKLQPVPSTGESVVDAQGTKSFLSQHSASMSTMMKDCVEEVPSTCKKDVGARKRLQKWSRGHLFVVRAGGHIEFWQTLYKSESPSQVFLILVSWLSEYLKTVPVNSWSNVAVVYDNMCHLDNMKVARKPLPLDWPWSQMWLSLHKCVDRLHIRNHTDKLCKTKYHPSDHLAETDNTLSAEQTFVWLSRFKKILCAMPKVKHMFYLHRMVVRRNRYTAYCYNSGTTQCFLL